MSAAVFAAVRVSAAREGHYTGHRVNGALVSTQDVMRAAVVSTVEFGRRVIRTVHAVIRITRKHVPAWLGAALVVALAIPGPIDELAVLVVVAVFAAFKPAMRAELRSGTAAAWKGAC